jgi:ornithine--oxo-acid transaminase
VHNFWDACTRKRAGKFSLANMPTPLATPLHTLAFSPTVLAISSAMSFDLKTLVSSRMGDNYALHSRHLNPTLVEVLRITGFDRVYVRADGAYLYDAAGNAYLDFLSGYSVFNMGRNHPVIKEAIRDVLDLDLPNMVQLDCSLLSGLLAEALLKKTPSHLEAVFFCNSGTEAIEGALKFARAATGRPGFIALRSLTPLLCIAMRPRQRR